MVKRKLPKSFRSVQLRDICSIPHVIENILAYLSIEDKLSLSSVNKPLYILMANEATIWKNVRLVLVDTKLATDITRKYQHLKIAGEFCDSKLIHLHNASSSIRTLELGLGLDIDVARKIIEQLCGTVSITIMNDWYFLNDLSKCAMKLKHIYIAMCSGIIGASNLQPFFHLHRDTLESITFSKRLCIEAIVANTKMKTVQLESIHIKPNMHNLPACVQTLILSNVVEFRTYLRAQQNINTIIIRNCIGALDICNDSVKRIVLENVFLSNIDTQMLKYAEFIDTTIQQRAFDAMLDTNPDMTIKFVRMCENKMDFELGYTRNYPVHHTTTTLSREDFNITFGNTIFRARQIKLKILLANEDPQIADLQSICYHLDNNKIDLVCVGNTHSSFFYELYVQF